MYYGDVTALRLAEKTLGNLEALDRDLELGHASFFGHWKVVDFLLAHGDTPLSWASRHLRPGAVLALLAHGDHRISLETVDTQVSDHGAGWGNGMEWKLVGEYLPESRPR